MQAIGPAATRHETASEFIDDDDFAVLHNVLLITEEQIVGTQRHHQMVHQGNMTRVIQRLFCRQKADFFHELFGTQLPGFR